MNSIFVKPSSSTEINGKKDGSFFRRFDSSFSKQRLWSRSETKLWTVNFFLGTCVLYASRVSLPICAVAMAKEYGWNKTDSGTILSCFFWGYAATQVIAGRIADLYGGERILPYTTLVWAILTMFTPQLFDFAYWSGWPLVILLSVRVLTGIGQGFHLPSMASIVSRHLTATDKGRVFGICLAGSHFGSVVAGGIGSLLIEWFGWRWLFHFVGFLSIFWYFLLNRMRRNASRRRKVHAIFDSSGNEVEESTPLSMAEDSEMPREKEKVAAGVPWAKLFRHHAFWAASAAQYCGANAYFTMFSWLPYYFSDNFPMAKALVYNVVPSLAIVFTSLLAPYLATKLLTTHGRSVTFTRRFMETFSLLGMSLCLLLVSFSTDFGTSLALFTMAMAVRGFHHGGVSVNPHDFAPDHTGSVFGIFNAFSAITGFIGVYVAGWILHASNNHWAFVFMFTAFQCLVGALIYGTMGTGTKII